QAPGRAVGPAGQVRPHAPPTQSWPLGPCRPQLPQLLGSLLVLTHVPLQRLCPDGQVQLPPLQLWPPPQTRPQTPQLLASVCRLTQPPAQAVSGLGQSRTQLP